MSTWDPYDEPEFEGAIQPCEHRCAHVEACPMCKPCDDALTRDLMEGL